MAKEQPQPRVVVVGSRGQNPLDGMLPQKCGLVAECCSNWWE